MLEERAALEAGEGRRLRRMKLGMVVTSLGGMTAAVGVLSLQDAIGQGRMFGLWMILGGLVTTIVGLLVSWKFRAGDATRRLEALGGRRDRVQRARTQQLTLLPFSMIIFSSLGVLAVERLFGDESREVTDWLMAAMPAIYAWLVASIVMGWDGGSRKEKRFLDDEFSRALRSRAITFAFFVLLAGATAVYGVGLFLPEIAIMAMPLVLGVAGASAGLRFAWLDRKAEQDG